MAPHITTIVAKVTDAQAKATSCAFVTFLVGNGDYVKGVVSLAKVLKNVNTIYPLGVTMLPNIPEEHRKILTSQSCIVRETEPVHLPEN